MSNSGVNWISGSPSSLMNWPNMTAELLKLMVNEIMNQVIEEAASKMRDFISNRGLPNSDGAGRIKTGEMLNAVSSTVTFAGTTVEGSFGWLDSGEIYFLAQEKGAVLWNGGVIAPMLAMFDAGQWAITEFVSKLRAALP